MTDFSAKSSFHCNSHFLFSDLSLLTSASFMPQSGDSPAIARPKWRTPHPSQRPDRLPWGQGDSMAGDPSNPQSHPNLWWASTSSYHPLTTPYSHQTKPPATGKAETVRYIAKPCLLRKRTGLSKFLSWVSSFSLQKNCPWGNKKRRDSY